MQLFLLIVKNTNTERHIYHNKTKTASSAVQFKQYMILNSV